MSHRHFSSLIKLSDHLVSLQNIVFLIKDKITDTFRYTQFYLPHARPVKVFLHGFDITRFLVHRSNLTNYSYYFLNYAFSIGFTIKDVRAYFHGFQAVTSRQPDIKRLMERGVKKAYQRTPQSTSAMNSAQLAEQSRVPFDSTSPGVKLYAKEAEKNSSAINFTRKQTAPFKDERVFRAALRLSCNRVTRFKVLETDLELKHTLLNHDLGTNGLLAFRSYLMELDPEFVSPNGLLRMLNEFAATNGWFKTGAKQFGEDQICQSLTIGDLRKMSLTTEMLPAVMFPADWNDLSLSKKYDQYA